MKLIVLYGPPAVGKQTVAEELAKHTGIKLFYGHLTWNAVNPIFPWGTDSFKNVLPDISLHQLKLWKTVSLNKVESKWER